MHLPQLNGQNIEARYDVPERNPKGQHPEPVIWLIIWYIKWLGGEFSEQYTQHGVVACSPLASFPGRWGREEKWPGTLFTHAHNIQEIISRIIRFTSIHSIRYKKYYTKSTCSTFVYSRVLKYVQTNMAVLCRICLTAVEQKHSTALFSDKGLELKWSDRLSELLCVPVCSDDLLEHICHTCRSRVESVEKKLAVLRRQARDSYEKLSSSRK